MCIIAREKQGRGDRVKKTDARNGTSAPETKSPDKYAQLKRNQLGSLKLTEQEENDLVSFLKTLTDTLTLGYR